jgi:hypothetical protein
VAPLEPAAPNGLARKICGRLMLREIAWLGTSGRFLWPDPRATKLMRLFMGPLYVTRSRRWPMFATIGNGNRHACCSWHLTCWSLRHLISKRCIIRATANPWRNEFRLGLRLTSLV